MARRAYTKGPWSLDDLIPSQSGREMELAFADVAAAAAAIELKRPALVPGIREETFGEMLGSVETLAYRAQRLSSYAGLLLSMNTADQGALACRGAEQGALLRSVVEGARRGEREALARRRRR
jgi:oligoendopeptidase F